MLSRLLPTGASRRFRSIVSDLPMTLLALRSMAAIRLLTFHEIVEGWAQGPRWSTQSAVLATTTNRLSDRDPRGATEQAPTNRRWGLESLHDRNPVHKRGTEPTRSPGEDGTGQDWEVRSTHGGAISSSLRAIPGNWPVSHVSQSPVIPGTHPEVANT